MTKQMTLLIVFMQGLVQLQSNSNVPGNLCKGQQFFSPSIFARPLQFCEPTTVVGGI